jgi:hypothetical protein
MGLPADYSNPKDDYKPSDQQQLASTISPGQFEISQAWAIGLASVPIVIAVLGILSCLGFNFGLLTRCCFRSCQCLPDGCCCSCLPRPTKDMDDDQKTKAVTFRRRMAYIFFAIFLSLALISDMISFAGNASVQAGITDLSNVVGGIGKIFSDLATDGSNLQVTQ